MKVEQLQEYVVSLRRYFHQYPELGLKEFNTCKRIADELTQMKIDFTYSQACPTCIYAEIYGSKKEGGTVALRADIDALPISEETGLEFSSKNEGIMHACGHDAHTAMLLGAAKLLVERKEEFCGKVKIIFEAAEEFGGAGRKIIEEGALQGADSAFAIHVQEGIPTGKVRIQSGICMAGAGFFSATIRGKGGHASAPHHAIDVIPAASAIVMGLQTAVSREISPLDSAVVSVGTFHAGQKANIIADKAELTGSLRFYTPEVQEKLPEAVIRIMKNIAAAYRTEVDIKCGCGLPPVVNDETCSNIARAALKSIGCSHQEWTCKPSTGSDDFAFYLQQVPGVYAFLGVGNPDGKDNFPAHSSRFCIDESPLFMGTQLYAQYAIEFLNQYQTKDNH